MAQPIVFTALDSGLRGLVIALLLVLAAIVLRDRARAPALRASLAMTLGLVVQVIGSAPLFDELVPRPWQAPFIAVSVGNAALFWIFVQALFDDDFAFGAQHVGAWFAAATLSGLNCMLPAGGGSVFSSLLGGVQRMLPLVFAVLAAVAALSNWRADLVEGRRRLRAFILVAGVIYTLATLVGRLRSPHGALTGLGATLDVAALLVIVAVVAWHLLRLNASDLLAPAAVPEAPALPTPAVEPDPAEERLAAALAQVMDTERPYRGENFSPAALAARLAVPEYRLRRLINQRLGHRNFNAFVNGYRLHDAQAALADPSHRETPVLTIALDAGFQSIGPFNRAFKMATGLTPTEFRREKLADS